MLLASSDRAGVAGDGAVVRAASGLTISKAFVPGAMISLELVAPESGLAPLLSVPISARHC